MILSSIKNYLTESSLYSRSIKNSNNLISDYIKDNIDKIFTDPEGAIEYNYDPDKNTLDFDLKETSKYIEMDLGLLSDISKKLECDIKNPIKFHFYHNPNIYFINENKNNTGYIENLFLDIVFEKTVLSGVNLYFNQEAGNFRNSNINITKNNKIKATYQFESDGFNYFTNLTELEKYLKDSIFNNPGCIIDNNHNNNFVLLRFRLNEFDKKYDGFIESIDNLYKGNDKKSKIIKNYQSYFLKNISSGKYNIEIINKINKDNPDCDYLYYYNTENFEILLKQK